jgi:putative ATP-dependent endonuclease of OLD family
MERSVASNETLNRILRQFDSDDYASSKRRGREQLAGPPVDYYFRRFVDNDPTVIVELVKLFHASDSYESFTKSVRDLIAASQSTIEALSDRPIVSQIRTFTGEEHTVPQYVKQVLGRIHATQILHFRERRMPIGSEEAKRLLSLKVKRGGTDVLARIQSTIDELLGVKVDAFEGPTDTRGQPTAELDVDQFLIQANGSGIRESLRLILDTEFSNPNMLLVEEPEIHLHPALETSIMSYLREISTERQVFITTHSTNFLDTGNFQNVFLVQKDVSTKLSPLTLAEAEQKLPAELGIRLSSLFMYDQILFVEGPSDEQILREFAKTLGVNLGQLNTGFIQMNGVRNLGHYAAAEVVAFLTKRRVKLRFIVDADESKSFHFQRLREEFGETAKVHVLKKREIENYLLCPSANIKHLISRRRPAPREDLPDEQSFRQLLSDVAESLKPLAVWKRILASASRPLYPKKSEADFPDSVSEMKDRAKLMLESAKSDANALISDLDKLCDDALKAVGDDWSNKKQDIVPGSAILDDIYKKFGFRYDKMRDGIGIASRIKKNEIDIEIRDFIAELSTAPTS